MAATPVATAQVIAPIGSNRSTCWSRVCTSDVHTVRGAIEVEPGRTHEAVGVVYRLGDAVTGLAEGQRVAVNAITPCWRCAYSQRGFTSQCQGVLGGYRYTAQMDGNLAEYFVVPAAEANLVFIPADLPDDKSVYVTEHAVHRVRRRRVRRTGDRRHRGRDRTGAGRAVGSIELTDGHVDAAIESFGFPQTFEQAVRITWPGGRISNIGYHGEEPQPPGDPARAIRHGHVGEEDPHRAVPASASACNGCSA